MDSEKTQHLAERIWRDTLRRRWVRLPGVKEMARDYAVSPVRISRALRLLASRGQLEGGRGRAYLVSSHSGAAGTYAHLHSVDRVAASIRANILAGIFRLEQPLPKLDYLTAHHGVSRPTVVAALRQLEIEGYSAKRGRTWIAVTRATKGPSPNLLSPGARGGVVVVVVTRLGIWKRMLGSSRTQELSRRFIEELELRGARISLWQLPPPGESSEPPALEVDRFVRDLGGDYLGVLFPDLLSHQAQIEPWLNAFLAHGKPVVRLDDLDEAPSQSRLRHPFSNFYRAHYSEQAVVRLALGSLSSLGHRRIGMANHLPNNAVFTRRRFAYLRQEAASLAGRTSVHLENLEVAFWRRPESSAQAVRERLKSRGWPITRDILRSHDDPVKPITPTSDHNILMYCAPVLVPLLFRHQVTALIAANDQVAAHYHHWLHLMGIRMPGEISLLSFDNLMETKHLSLSSVDFGWSSLGHSLAHLFLGDLPVSADRYGNLSALPRLSGLGTLAPPRRTDLLGESQGDLM